jgi:hypothetical protein
VLAILFLFPSCASQKDVKTWNPGESVICPHCAREFPVSEKLGQ